MRGAQSVDLVLSARTKSASDSTPWPACGPLPHNLGTLGDDPLRVCVGNGQSCARLDAGIWLGRHPTGRARAGSATRRMVTLSRTGGGGGVRLSRRPSVARTTAGLGGRIACPEHHRPGVVGARRPAAEAHIRAEIAVPGDELAVQEDGPLLRPDGQAALDIGGVDGCG
jgi:hypothetical protein